MTDKLLTIDEVAEAVGVKSRSTVYSWVKKGLFPKGATLGPKLRRWQRSDIEQWQRDNGLARPADQ